MNEKNVETPEPIIIHVGCFTLGALVATPGALEVLEPDEMAELLNRHAACDWGDLCEEDIAENSYSLAHNLRLLSSYTSRSGDKIWIITEADRSATTVLLPSEY